MNNNKDITGKLDYTTVPISAITGIAKVREYGIAKYKDRDNWKTVDPELYKQALLRHLYSWLDGENFDKESGLCHMDHMLCNLAFLRDLLYVEVNK